MAEATKTQKQIDRKARLKIPPPPVPKQDPKGRVRNWDEVYLGYDLPTALADAKRAAAAIDRYLREEKSAAA